MTITHGHAPTEAPRTGTAWQDDDARLVAAMRDGDEAAFAALLDRYHRALVDLALAFLPTRAAAEQVARETWLGLFHRTDVPDGPSPIRGWLFRALADRARRRGRQDGDASWSPPAPPGPGVDETAVEADRFQPAGETWAGHWLSPPRDWGERAEQQFRTEAGRARLAAAIANLPPVERAVIALRDVHGLDAMAVAAALELDETEQRAHLRRARTRVRRALEAYLAAA